MNGGCTSTIAKIIRLVEEANIQITEIEIVILQASDNY